MNDEDKKSTDFAVAVKSIRDNLLAHLEYAELNSKIMKAKFDSLVKAGFSIDQALVLCK